MNGVLLFWQRAQKRWPKITTKAFSFIKALLTAALYLKQAVKMMANTYLTVQKE